MMRLAWLAALGCGILWAQEAEVANLHFGELPEKLRLVLRGSGLTKESYPEWLRRYEERRVRRLAEGVAEHVVYFSMQSGRLSKLAKVAPGRAAVSEQGERIARQRLREFFAKEPVDERHALLRRMHASLDQEWTEEKMLQHSLGFLREKRSASDGEANRALFQRRGLSEDPFPETMEAVKEGLAWLGREKSAWKVNRVLLVGPGMELGSRFGLAEELPIAGAQPGNLRRLLGDETIEMDCADIREQVREVFAQTECRGLVMDIVTARPARAAYDLVVATNVLVYMNDSELALALSNLAEGLRPGGCLIHNDERFAARAFGEMTGAPVVAFLPVAYPTRAGGAGVDRAVVHCRAE